jgi:hypothetical protein
MRGAHDFLKGAKDGEKDEKTWGCLGKSMGNQWEVMGKIFLMPSFLDNKIVGTRVMNKSYIKSTSYQSIM